MTSEFLLDAIGRLDDDLVLEAAAPKKHTVPRLKAAGLVAALVLCAGIASLPGLSPLRGANSGAAAPESDGALTDTTTSDILADYEYRSEQEFMTQEPSAANKSETQSATGGTQGFCEPRFFTQRGVYLLTVSDSGELKKKVSPPENAVYLGELAAAVSGQGVYPSTGTQELVGCPVWESEDGQLLYIQFPNEEWLVAMLLD